MLLKFSPPNKKLKKIPTNKRVYSMSIPSGYSCPQALDCLSKADPLTGKITDGKHMLHRCYSTSNESSYPAVRKQRHYNFELLRQEKEFETMYSLINESLPHKAELVRIHVGGDFYNQMYFDSWLHVARTNPGVLFYAYTKSIPFWITALNYNNIPDNMRLTASRGGRSDYLIDLYGLKTAEVVYTEAEAREKNLEIDTDESHAIWGDKSFALLIHGTQPKGFYKKIKQLELVNV